MTIGHVRDNLLRVVLMFPGQTGPVPVEFLVDTGFDGELALPGFILQQLVASFSIDQEIMLADGSRGRRPLYRVDMVWDDDLRPTDVLLLEGIPLLGVNLLAGSLLQAEMTDGGEVSIELL